MKQEPEFSNSFEESDLEAALELEEKLNLINSPSWASELQTKADTFEKTVNRIEPSHLRFDGCVYALTNPSMPGLLKIGCTTRDLEQRVKEVSNSTGVPTSFEIASAYYSDNCIEDEKAIHSFFRQKRINEGREFFSVSVTDFNEFCSEFLKPLDAPVSELIQGKRYFTSVAYSDIRANIRISETTLENLEEYVSGDLGTVASAIINFFIENFTSNFLLEGEDGKAVMTFFPNEIDVLQRSAK